MPRKRAMLKPGEKRLVFKTGEDLNKFMTGYDKELEERRKPQYSYTERQDLMKFLKEYDPKGFDRMLKRKRKRK